MFNAKISLSYHWPSHACRLSAWFLSFSIPGLHPSKKTIIREGSTCPRSMPSMTPSTHPMMLWHKAQQPAAICSRHAEPRAIAMSGFRQCPVKPITHIQICSSYSSSILKTHLFEILNESPVSFLGFLPARAVSIKIEARARPESFPYLQFTLS